MSDESDDELLRAGLLYAWPELLLLEVLLPTVEEDALRVRFPTLMPPLTVPVVALTVLEPLPDELCLPATEPVDSVLALRPWYTFCP